MHPAAFSLGVSTYVRASWLRMMDTRKNEQRIFCAARVCVSPFVATTIQPDDATMLLVHDKPWEACQQRVGELQETGCESTTGSD